MKNLNRITKLIFIMFILILFFTSCITDPKRNVQNTQSTFNNNFISQKIEKDKSIFSLKKDLYAVEITFKGKIDKNKFIFNDAPFKIINYDNNNTIVSVSFGKLQKNGTNFLSISGNPSILKVEGINVLNAIITKNATDTTPMLLGDFNHDSYIDLFDFAYFREHYKTFSGNPNYDKLYDIYPSTKGEGLFESIFSLKQPDGKINIFDFAIFAINYRKTANRTPVVKILSPIENEELHEGANIISWDILDPDFNKVKYDIYLNNEKIDINPSISQKNN